MTLLQKANKVILSKQIVVVMGGEGLSNEFSISLASGKNIFNILKSSNLNVIEYIINSSNLINFMKFLMENRDRIIIFNTLHGSFGEDGSIQGILDSLQIPYTHSGQLASTIAMNKSITKKIANSYSIPVPREQIVDLVDNIPNKKDITVPYPLIIKPIDEGSSIGVELISSYDEFLASYKLNRQLGKHQIMLEEYLPGKEYTVGVYNNKALAVTEISMPENLRVFDYKTKYMNDQFKAQNILPAKLNEQSHNNMLMWAETAFKGIGAKDAARVDFKADSNGNIFFLEINTSPGMSSKSLLPEQLKYKNINLLDFLLSILIQANYGR